MDALTGLCRRRPFSIACVALRRGPALTPDLGARLAKLRGNRCLRIRSPDFPLAKFVLPAQKWLWDAAGKLFWGSQASNWKGERMYPRSNLRMALICNLGNTSTDVDCSLQIGQAYSKFAS